MKNDIIRLGLILAIISCVASGTLAIVNNVTSPIIARQIQEENDQARRDLLPEAQSFELIEGTYENGIVEVYSALNGTENVGYIIKSTTKGYGGDFDVMTGIKSDGVVSGVKLSNINETPGLGAKAVELSFIDQYQDISVEKPAFVNKNSTGAESEIVAISGATITSEAVTVGVNNAMDFYNNNLK